MPSSIVQSLLEAYPQALFLKDVTRQAPLHAAVECGSSEEVMKLLVASLWKGNCAAIMSCNQAEDTPLDMAVQQQAPLDVVCLLSEAMRDLVPRLTAVMRAPHSTEATNLTGLVFCPCGAIGPVCSSDGRHLLSRSEHIVLKNDCASDMRCTPTSSRI